jgi:hypothetical protein
LRSFGHRGGYKKYHWKLLENFEQSRQAILENENKQVFCNLLDLTGFGLAGFDILVPRCLWPIEDGGQVVNGQNLYCVEVKSVGLKPSNGSAQQMSGAEIILTTHEYRVAQQGKAPGDNPTYPHLLRLVGCLLVQKILATFRNLFSLAILI